MAFWGVGLAESDEFCEAYEEYICLYEIGNEPEYITEYFLNKYEKEFSGENNIPHNIYFAMAKAEWMLCSQSEKVLSRIQNIIENEENIEYYRLLDFLNQSLLKEELSFLSFLKL